MDQWLLHSSGTMPEAVFSLLRLLGQNVTIWVAYEVENYILKTLEDRNTRDFLSP